MRAADILTLNLVKKYENRRFDGEAHHNYAPLKIYSLKCRNSLRKQALQLCGKLAF